MNSEHQVSWHRHIVFDPMNAHSQADDPALTYVMQFNADERKVSALSILAHTLEMSLGELLGKELATVDQRPDPAPKLRQHQPRAQQRFVMQAINTALDQQGR